MFFLRKCFFVVYNFDKKSLLCFFQDWEQCTFSQPHLDVGFMKRTTLTDDGKEQTMAFTYSLSLDDDKLLKDCTINQYWSNPMN